jgi:hypothetical protein
MLENDIVELKIELDNLEEFLTALPQVPFIHVGM